ncbi:MAG TPA: hypothetical protein VFX49_01055 [Chloroflexota bacterium]|nr:hypothetical protein [Chloroflexota bacterium]
MDMDRFGRALPLPADQDARTALGGFVATGLLSGAVVAANRLGLLRLDFGRMLGTLLGPDTARTRALGWALNMANGVVFAFGYREAFRRLGMFPGAPAGLVVGVPHSLMAMALVAAMPYVHPRPKEAGLRDMSPFAYGRLTLPGMVLGHVMYGVLVGWFVGAGRRTDVVSQRFLRWLDGQAEAERRDQHPVPDSGEVRKPVELAARRASRAMQTSATQAVRASRAA